MNVSDDLSKWSMAFEDASYANSVLGKLTTVVRPSPDSRRGVMLLQWGHVPLLVCPSVIMVEHWHSSNLRSKLNRKKRSCSLYSTYSKRRKRIA